MFCTQEEMGFYEKEAGARKDIFFWNDNICSDMINDDRQEKWKEMREKYGFDSRELWSLQDTIACFIYPRLKYFREANPGNPACLTNEEWLKILDKMIWSFEQHVNGNYYAVHDNEDKFYKKYNKGIKLFYKWFNSLWC
ncbi:MAG: hypothetical protein BWY47_00938 [Bacteroidetes bacterium ADurb.Bin302]|nr:MAG: hypothetical protein BWY47_00938 [Bacteroidetes bacterium ADurb.Bin302]